MKWKTYVHEIMNDRGLIKGNEQTIIVEARCDQPKIEYDGISK